MMFSDLLAQAKAKYPGGMDVVFPTFDNTPPPSTRTSLEAPTSKYGVSRTVEKSPMKRASNSRSISPKPGTMAKKENSPRPSVRRPPLSRKMAN